MGAEEKRVKSEPEEGVPEGEWDSIGGEGGQAWLPTLRLTEAWLKGGLILTPIDCGSESLPPEHSGRGRFGCVLSALFNH